MINSFSVLYTAGDIRKYLLDKINIFTFIIYIILIIIVLICGYILYVILLPITMILFFTKQYHNTIRMDWKIQDAQFDFIGGSYTSNEIRDFINGKPVVYRANYSPTKLTMWINWHKKVNPNFIFIV